VNIPGTVKLSRRNLIQHDLATRGSSERVGSRLNVLVLRRPRRERHAGVGAKARQPGGAGSTPTTTAPWTSPRPRRPPARCSAGSTATDGTLDRRELRGRVDAKEFAAVDPDKDGTLTKDEYFTIVEKRFKAADGRKIAHQGGPRVAAPAGVLERMPVQMNRDASRFSRWRISFFGKPASTFPGYALGRTGATV
jgi:hypothetical protein